jgi:FkbM family methyltransferase
MYNDMAIPEPTIFRAPILEKPSGNALTRACRALLVEHRMPYVLRQRWDRILKRAGIVSRTAKLGGYRVSFRRCSTDEAFIENVLQREEYFRPGYRPSAGQIVIDIGANMGCFTLAAARYGARVIAVEPHPDNLRYLRRNVAANRIDAEVIGAAVAASDGTCRLFTGSDTGYHSLRFNAGRGYTDVPAMTLSNLLARVEHCELMKIDCEGAEFDFIPAAPI